MEVNPFTPDYKAITAKVVDAAIRYDCPYEGQSYILIIRNAIQVPSMENNLIPPFLLREAGIIVNDKAKIHVADTTVDNHAIVFPTTGFRIRLMLWGVFSYFSSWMPTEDDMRAGHDVYVLTPERWNPHTDTYARNEDNIVEWEGNVKEAKDRIMTLELNQANNDDLDHRMYSVSGAENKVNDCICAIRDDKNNRCTYENSQMEWANNDAQMKEISSMYSVDELGTLLERKMNLGYDQIAIGAITTSGDEPESLVYRDGEEETTSDDDISLEDLELSLDLDEVFASGVRASRQRWLDAEHLASIWRISYDDAKRTIELTSQHSKCTVNPDLTQNYGTNDHMLRYHWIRDYFYIDTFFATSKGGKSSHGNTCCQLFMTDKGFLYVVPMKRKSEVMLAVKQFAKEVGAPDSIVCDMSKEQTHSDLRMFCHDIGTTLHALEEGTPWANKAELYIKWLKEAVRKDMREANSPLCFWDYCIERRA